MIKEIKSTSLGKAFELVKDFDPIDTVILEELKKPESYYEDLGLSFCYIKEESGNNTNKNITSVFNNPSGVTKKWKTAYKALWDHPLSRKVITGADSVIKKIV